LDTDAKNAEILRLLPLMAPFTIEFTSMQQALDNAVTRLEQVQVQGDSNLGTSSFSVENHKCLDRFSVGAEKKQASSDGQHIQHRVS
jgi:hypothetical protein